MTPDGFKIIAPLAYMGKKDCTDPHCRRMIGDGARPGCLGWHCSYCDSPCGSQGHKCDVATTLIDAAKEAAE